MEVQSVEEARFVHHTAQTHHCPSIPIPLQCGYCYRGHPDKVNQSQSRTETVDFSIFTTSANEISNTEQ